ncbi:MAG: ATP-binding cassette domain-containing protein [Bdellovibrionota bacterium]|nr:MAG: ATP-binding cassette domain-containing protein [Bdellovibrionota bacterium]
MCSAFAATIESPSPLIRLRGVHKSFGLNHVLRGVDMDCRPQELSGLIGPSGGGKSVLLKLMAGVSHPDSGMIERHLDLSDMSLMFQEGALFDSLSLFDNVAFPLLHGDVPVARLSDDQRHEVQPLVSSILDRVGLRAAAWKMPAQLSGGMRRRAALARALVAKPRVCLLDDPTAGLDPVASSVIMNLIVELWNETKPTLIVVSHDLRRLLPAVHTVRCLFHGQLAYQGSPRDLQTLPSGEIRRFISCRFDLDDQSACARLSS